MEAPAAADATSFPPIPQPRPPPKPPSLAPASESGSVLTINAPEDYEQSLLTPEERSRTVIIANAVDIAWHYLMLELRSNISPQKLILDAPRILQLLKYHNGIDSDIKAQMLKQLEQQNTARDPAPVSSLLLLCFSPATATKEVVKVGLCAYTFLLAVAGDDMDLETPKVRSIIQKERKTIETNQCTEPMGHLMAMLVECFKLRTFWHIATRNPMDDFHLQVSSKEGYKMTFSLGHSLGMRLTNGCPGCPRRHPDDGVGQDWNPSAQAKHTKAIFLLGGELLTGPTHKYASHKKSIQHQKDTKPTGARARDFDACPPTSIPPDWGPNQVAAPLNPSAESWTPSSRATTTKRARAAPSAAAGTPGAVESQVPQKVRAVDTAATSSTPITKETKPTHQGIEVGGKGATTSLDTYDHKEGRTNPPKEGVPTLYEDDMVLSRPTGEIIDAGDDEDMPDLVPIGQAQEYSPPQGGNQLGCAACLEPVVGEHSLCSLECSHHLHTTCAESWFCHTNTCPVCRATCTISKPGRLPAGDPTVSRSISFDTGAFLTNVVGNEGQRLRLRQLGLAGPTLHMTLPHDRRTTSPPRDLLPSARAPERQGGRASCCTRTPLRGMSVGATPRAVSRRRNISVVIDNVLRRHRSPNNGQAPLGLPRTPRTLVRNRPSQANNVRQGRRNTTTNSMTPWARMVRPWAKRPNATRQTRERASPIEGVLAFALNVIFAVLTAFILVSLPSAKAEMIDDLPPPTPASPSMVNKFNLNDVLIFESYPRSVSLALTSEEVDLSILFKLKSKLASLAEYASLMAGNNLVPLAQAPGYCRPHGYASSLTPVLSKALKFPHYINLHETMNTAEKVYVATLREDEMKSRYCNYSLSYASKFSLTSVLDLGSSYYSVDRDRKYHIYKTWIVDRRGRPCKDGLSIHRGEIAPQDMDFEIPIDHTDGSVFSCAAYCSNWNGLREQALRNAACILGETCKPYAQNNCETYSYSWKFNRCRLSSKANPVRDLATQEGWNSLVAFRDCKALVQHQEAKILVNGSLYDISHVCKYTHHQASATSSIYRSCPGISHGLQSDINPLQTTLDRYILSLDSIDKSREGNANHTLSLRAASAKEKRSLPKAPPLLSALKPALTSFLTIGTNHLATGIGLKFLGNALPLANLLMLGTSLVALAVNLAIDLAPAIHHEPIAELGEMKTQSYADWRLIRSPDLFKLHPLSEACRADNDIKHSNAIPELLTEIGDSLKSLQLPLTRLIRDASPLSEKVHQHISDEESSVYGFWSVYHPTRRALVRYFTFQVEGGPNTMSRQTAVLSGSSVAPINEGTLIQGGSRKPGTIGPSWSCVEYVINTKGRNSTWVPESCYGATLHHKEVYSTAFLPSARIYRIFGRHRTEYACPRSSQGSIVSRGLLILLVPNNCLFTIDSMSMRSPDSSSTSAWVKPIRLVDRATEYEARKDATYPKSLHRAISTLANDTLLPAITNINLMADNTRKVQHKNDVGLTIAMCFLGLATLAAMCFIYWKLSKEYSWAFMPTSALASRMRMPRRWSGRPTSDQPGTAEAVTNNESSA